MRLLNRETFEEKNIKFLNHFKKRFYKNEFNSPYGGDGAIGAVQCEKTKSVIP